MKFIHTADWHLGNQLHNLDRREETENFLRWLKNETIRHNAQALVIAGDIYDAPNPSNETKKQFKSFLASLVGTCCKNIIIVGGNHDSATLLDSDKEVLNFLNIRVVGSITNVNIEELCCNLVDSDNNIVGICGTVPYIREIDLRKFSNDNVVSDSDSYNAAYKSFYDKLYQIVQKLECACDVPIIMTGHLYAANLEGRLANALHTEKYDDGMKVLDVVGNLGNVQPSIFPPVDYVALGHIHYTTMVDNNPRIRYSGSPFVMGFDDADVPHYCLLVDVKKKTIPLVEKLMVPATCIYKRLSGNLATINDKLNELITNESKSKANAKKTFLEICYEQDYTIDIVASLNEITKQLPVHVSIVNYKPILKQKDFNATTTTKYAVHEVKNLTEKEIFTQLILKNIELDYESDEAKKYLDKFLPLFMEISKEV